MNPYPLSDQFPTEESYHAELVTRLDALNAALTLPDNAPDRIGQIGRDLLPAKHGLVWSANLRGNLCMLLAS